MLATELKLVTDQKVQERHPIPKDLLHQMREAAAGGSYWCHWYGPLTGEEQARLAYEGVLVVEGNGNSPDSRRYFRLSWSS